MMEKTYPKMIKDLPEADVPFKGVKGWLLQGVDKQVVFFEFETIGVVPEHSHGEQWGVVIEGEMELAINGVRKIYRKGDCYHIPTGAPHSATFKTHCKIIDFFAEVSRFQPKRK